MTSCCCAPGVRTAVVTGHHPFDVPAFRDLFCGLEGVDPYIQHMEDFACSSPETRAAYDVVLFYNMHMETPGEGGPWYAGNMGTALEELGRAAQGIVVLHHAILAFPQWPLWSEIVGIEDRSFGYYYGETVRSEIVRPEHPIVAGFEPWEMVDETYTMASAEAGSEVLITYDHPHSMKTIAWTRQHKDARVFCYEAGHDNLAYADLSFREVLRRGILWSADRL